MSIASTLVKRIGDRNWCLAGDVLEFRVLAGKNMLLFGVFVLKGM
jgi:hypothetical protein